MKVVYLLGRSGNRLGALDLMVNKLLRIDMAIDFCAENEDPELWDRLIESAIKRPEQIAILLKRMASIKVNSLGVVEKVRFKNFITIFNIFKLKIPLHMDIPDLRQCLLQVLRDHEQQRDLLTYSKKVATSDVLALLEMQLKPMTIVSDFESGSSGQDKCAICQYA